MAKGNQGHGAKNAGGTGAELGMGRGLGMGLGKGDGHAHGGASTFTFTFSSDSQTVQSMSQVRSTATQAIDITGSTFQTTVGVNDLGATAVTAVAQTQVKTNETETRIYKDMDGDGQYSNAFGIDVVTVTPTSTSTTTALTPRSHQFTFNTDGTVATDSFQHRGTWTADAITTNEVYSHVTLNGDSYVVKTTSGTAGYCFEIFQDDNADGVWSEIAHGQSAGDNIDTATGTVNLVGIQSYLAAADAVIG